MTRPSMTHPARTQYIYAYRTYTWTDPSERWHTLGHHSLPLLAQSHDPQTSSRCSRRRAYDATEHCPCQPPEGHCQRQPPNTTTASQYETIHASTYINGGKNNKYVQERKDSFGSCTIEILPCSRFQKQCIFFRVLKKICLHYTL